MNINIYDDYIVLTRIVTSLLSEENTSKYDNIFVEDEYKTKEVLNGSILLDMIKRCLEDEYLSEFTIVGNDLHFEYFNYNNGESKCVSYTVYYREANNG